uniref:phosphatidylinositol 5-phosphate 4-kinase type-2 beta isoform X2 n=1 Tax=Myxine glutinosa TaxID=7769 RepID=UPI00358F8214
MAASSSGSDATSRLHGRMKTKKRHFVAQKMKLFRASEPLYSVLMWGVSHTVNELSSVPPPVILLPDDFKASSKVKVDNHLFNKGNLPSHFKFKEYCPLVFRNLRERFSVSEQEYLVSVTRAAPINSDSHGRSTGRFLTSFDGRLIIKTITGEDVAEMHSMLKKYHQYVVECHGATLLPQFLGMYRLTVDGVETYMLMMCNVFNPQLRLHRKYDLKGSTVAREASEKEKAKELPTLKDKDFINEKQKLCVGEENKKMVLGKLKKDVEFLATLKIMDYSLLVGIHDVERAEIEEAEEFEREEEEDDEDDDDDDDEEEEEEEGEEGMQGSNGTSESQLAICGTPPETLFNLVPCRPGEVRPGVDVYAVKSYEGAPRKEVYFVAIIDILTPYDTKKKAAHAAKTVKHGAGAEISTVNPEQYSRRFLEFTANIMA